MKQRGILSLRRALCALLAALLCAVMGAPALASSAPGTPAPAEITLLSVMGQGGDYVWSMCSDGKDGLYILGRSLYHWAPGQAEPTPIIEELSSVMNPDTGDALMEPSAFINIYRLANDGETIYALDNQLGMLYKLEGETLVPAHQIDWADMARDRGGWKESRYIAMMRFVEGKLYMLCSQLGDYGAPYEFQSIDLASGKRTLHDVKNIMEFDAYKPGKMIARFYDNQRRGEVEPTVQVLDIATMKPEGPALVLEDHGSSGIAYDAEADMTFYSYNNQIVGTSDFMATQSVGYTISASTESLLAITLPGRMIATCSYGGLHVRSTDPARMSKTALTVMGSSNDDVAVRYMSMNPGKPIMTINEWMYDEATLTQSMQGDSAADIYLLGSDLPIKDILAKGYGVDLSGDAVISKAVSEMHPALRDIATVDGKVAGVPVNLSTSIMSVNMTMWEELGLGELPKTIAEFLELALRWEEEIADEHPDYQFIQTDNPAHWKSEYLNFVLRHYILYYLQEDGQIKFDTPVLREAMTKLETLDYEPAPEAQNVGGGGYSVNARQCLFTSINASSFGITSRRGSTDVVYETMTPLVFEEGQTPKMQAEVEVAIINPNSQNREAALEYMRFLITSARPEEALTFYPDRNDPILDKRHEKYLIESAEELEKEKARTDVKPEEKKQHDDMIKMIEENIEFMEQGKWIVSAEDIASYRKVEQYLTISSLNIYNIAGERNAVELSELMNRYESGSMNLDQLVKELDDKMRTIYLEGR